MDEIVAEIASQNSLLDVRSHWSTVSSKLTPEGECLTFPELFRPTKIAEFLAGREDNEALQKVASWMNHWRAVADRRRRETEQDTDGKHRDIADEDEFTYDSTEEEEVTRALFLYGRSGVGKSALVHAVAAEFNFKVIEVHAGQDRNGQVLRETLHEATQSNTVSKAKKQDIQNFFKERS